MPQKNGLECLQEIKSNKKLKDITIVIYSTSDSEKDMDDTFLNGATIYIIKPHNFKKLTRVLKRAVMTSFSYKDPLLNRENFLLRIE